MVVVVDEVVILTGTEVDDRDRRNERDDRDGRSDRGGRSREDERDSGDREDDGTDATKMIAVQDVMMTAARKILSVEADRHRKENQNLQRRK